MVVTTRLAHELEEVVKNASLVKFMEWIIACDAALQRVAPRLESTEPAIRSWCALWLGSIASGARGAERGAFGCGDELDGSRVAACIIRLASAVWQSAWARRHR